MSATAMLARTDAPAIERVNVLGVGVSAIDIPLAVATIEGWIAAREPHFVCVSGVHGVMESQRDRTLRDIHNRAGLVTPDGMPLVWFSRLAGYTHVTRVYGPDLMEAVCRDAVTRVRRHFFYGGLPGVPERLAARLTARFPGLQVVGTFSPPYRALSSAEDQEIIERIDASGAEVVWVGLSTPKQERWMASHVGGLRAPVLIGVGAAFDFLSGVKRQAPRWMQQSGLEWCFRLASEPSRLWRRYLVNNPVFVWNVLLQATRIRRYELS